MSRLEVDGVLVPFSMPSARQGVEVRLPARPMVLGTRVLEENLGVEVQYGYDPDADVCMSRRVMVAMGAGSIVHDAYHLATYTWLGQLWHIFVENDQT